MRDIDSPNLKEYARHFARRYGVTAGVTFLVGMFVFAFVKTAWVTEDAFISFRVVDNFLHGYGLVWNPGERVQVYTHPLWLFALIPVVAAGIPPYYASLLLSFVLFLVVVALLFRLVGPRSRGGLLVVGSLLWSRAFIDYSSSGLENPLTHFLLLLFALVWLHDDRPPRRQAARLGVLTAALYLCRPDAVVLVTPALLWWAYEHRAEWRSWWRRAALGLLPMVLWTIFSLFYYGSPVANTAVAKVATGLPLSKRLAQALDYLRWSVAYDGFTLALLLMGAVMGLTSDDLRKRGLAWGLVLWLVYLGYVGADYMGGRFFSAATVLAVVMLADGLRRPARLSVWGLTLALVTQLSSFHRNIHTPLPSEMHIMGLDGVVDERHFYWRNALMQVLGTTSPHPWLRDGQVLREFKGTYVRCVLGMTPFVAGPRAEWIDPLALTDPFLARLPARDHSRVGHYERAFPEGYLASRATGKNLIRDSILHALYDDVRRVTRGPLWAPGRFAAIVRLNFGHYDVKESSFDRNAIGLPGIPVGDLGPNTCLGAPYRWDITYRIDWDEHEQQVHVTQLPIPRTQLESQSATRHASSHRGAARFPRKGKM